MYEESLIWLTEKIKVLKKMAQLTSCTKTPDRLVTMGPDFLRRRSNSGNTGIFAHRRKSAVELLEASKSEYVKSSSVLNHRQELKHPENLHVGNRPKSGGVSGSQIKQSKSDYVISHHLNTAKSAEKETTDNSIKSINSYSSSLIESGTSTPDRKNGPVLFDIDGSSADSAKIHKSSDLEKSSNIVSSTSIRRKSPISGSSDKYINKSCVSSADMDQKSKGDGKAKVDGKLLEVTSADVEKSSKTQDCLLPNTYQSLSSSVNVLVEKRCSSPSNHNLDKESVLRRKKKGLHRSHSDLSCRHSRNSSDFSDISSRLSRTSTELERFFNEMGIDKSVLDPMIKLHEQCRKGSEFWESVSSLNSVSDRKSSCSSVHSQQGDKGKSSEKDLKERPSQSTSIVEKNARIIKWLYNVKKAGHPQQAS